MDNPSSQLTVIVTSFADEKTALCVVRTLVRERLAACGTILPKAHSTYLWQGKIEEAAEAVVFFKTSQGLTEQCKLRLAELHPYDVPEIFSLEPSAVDASYLAWLGEVLE
ncbi:MAG: divalent-cation tolerance protein CutA [Chthoniobacterales bacterium]